MSPDTLMWSKIQFPNHKPSKVDWPKVKLVEGQLEKRAKVMAIGVDPGVNFGITVIHNRTVSVMNGKLGRRELKGWHGIDAFQLVKDVCTIYFIKDFGNAVVEGAAYHSQFGQVGLEEVRFGFFFGLYQSGLRVRIVPPATIRLRAFGDGKQQAGDLWPWMNHNAADSLGMALYALEMVDA